MTVQLFLTSSGLEDAAFFPLASRAFSAKEGRQAIMEKARRQGRPGKRRLRAYENYSSSNEAPAATHRFPGL